MTHDVLGKMTVQEKMTVQRIRVRRPLATAAATSRLLLLLPALTAVAVVAQPTTCGFCPGGTPPLNPSALMDEANDNTTTCGDAHNLLLTGVSPGDDCTAARADAVLALDGGYPAHCGYCPAAAGAADGSGSACSLCPTGDLPSLPAGTPVALPDGTASTCGEASYLAQLERIFSNECLELQSLAPHCGCRPTTCAVCPDGGDLPDPSKWSFAAEMPCGDVVRNAAALDPLGDDCRTVQTIAMGECGCAYVPPPAPGCALCSDGGAVPDPSFQLFPGDDLSTCGLYGWYAALPPFGTGDERCSAMQSTFGAACGCPAPPRPPCSVRCRGYLDEETGLYQDVVFNATHVLEDFAIGDADYRFEDQHICGEILFEMSINDDLCTLEGIAALQEECCMVPYVPPEPETSDAGTTGSRSMAAVVSTAAIAVGTCLAAMALV